MNGSSNARKILAKYKKDKLFITELSIFEISVGIFNNKSNKEFDIFLKFLENLEIIPTNSMFSLDSAKIQAELRNKGITIDEMDILIAGMMKAFGISKIVTKNKKHFEKIKGINVISY